MRAALLKYKDKTRLWYRVEWKKENFKYVCAPDYQMGIEGVAGLEEIYKDKEKVYYLYYAGGVIG